MTRVRFLTALFAAITAVLANAAPVPKGAGQPDPTPDLKAVFAVIGKAVQAEKWPAEADEKLIRDSARAIFERATKAADQKDRKLPVDFATLTKPGGAVKEFNAVRLEGEFVIAGDVRLTAAKDSVIFASGNVQITRATNCVIIAQNVRGTAIDNCVVVAGDSVRATGADRREREEGSVLIAGRLIRVTGARGAICHVLQPAFGQQFPEEKLRDPMSPPIRLTTANQVTVLNAAEHWKATSNKNSVAITPKTVIAK
jgi:hypothetical protein